MQARTTKHDAFHSVRPVQSRNAGGGDGGAGGTYSSSGEHAEMARGSYEYDGLKIHKKTIPKFWQKFKKWPTFFKKPLFLGPFDQKLDKSSETAEVN